MDNGVLRTECVGTQSADYGVRSRQAHTEYRCPPPSPNGPHDSMENLQALRSSPFKHSKIQASPPIPLPFQPFAFSLSHCVCTFCLPPGLWAGRFFFLLPLPGPPPLTPSATAHYETPNISAHIQSRVVTCTECTGRSTCYRGW